MSKPSFAISSCCMAHQVPCPTPFRRTPENLPPPTARHQESWRRWGTGIRRSCSGSLPATTCRKFPRSEGGSAVWHAGIAHRGEVETEGFSDLCYIYQSTYHRPTKKSDGIQRTRKQGLPLSDGF